MSCYQEFVQLKDEEIEKLRWGLAYVRAIRMVNVSEVQRMVVGYLMIDHRRIRVSDLEILTGYSRKTIRTALVDLEKMDLADHLVGEGWRLTCGGFAVFVLLYREASSIANGRYAGYSDMLIRILESLPTEGVNRPFTPKGGGR